MKIPAPCPLFSRSAPAAAANGKRNGHASLSGCASERHGIATYGGALTVDANSTKQTNPRPASNGAALRGALTPTSGPRRSTARPEPRSTTKDPHGTYTGSDETALPRIGKAPRTVTPGTMSSSGTSRTCATHDPRSGTRRAISARAARHPPTHLPIGVATLRGAIPALRGELSSHFTVTASAPAACRVRRSESFRSVVPQQDGGSATAPQRNRRPHTTPGRVAHTHRPGQGHDGRRSSPSGLGDRVRAAQRVRRWRTPVDGGPRPATPARSPVLERTWDARSATCGTGVRSRGRTHGCGAARHAMRARNGAQPGPLARRPGGKRETFGPAAGTDPPPPRRSGTAHQSSLQRAAPACLAD